MDDKLPPVTVVVPTKDRPDCLPRLLRSIRRQDYPDLSVVVVDDGSAPPARVEDPKVLVLRSEESRGISAARNLGIRRARGEFIIGMDDDAEFLAPDTVSRAVRLALKDPRVGAVAFKQLSADGTGRPAGIQPLELEEERACYTSHFVGYGFLLRRSAFDAAGGFNEFFRYGHEEIELSLRLHHAGYQVVYDPSLGVIHHEEQRGRDEKARRRLIRLRMITMVALHYPLPLALAACATYSFNFLRVSGGLLRGDWPGLFWVWRETWSSRAYLLGHRKPLPGADVLAFRRARIGHPPFPL